MKVIEVLATVAGEHHDRRLVRHGIEKGVRREIDLAFPAHGGDPADRSRHNDRFEGIARQSMVVLARVVEHRCLRLVIAAAGRPT